MVVGERDHEGEDEGEVGDQAQEGEDQPGQHQQGPRRRHAAQQQRARQDVDHVQRQQGREEHAAEEGHLGDLQNKDK